MSFRAIGDVSGYELDQRAAARMQHEQARRIRAAIAEHGITLTQYGRQSGMNYRRLTRLLGGYILMQLDDVANTQRTLARLAER